METSCVRCSDVAVAGSLLLGGEEGRREMGQVAEKVVSDFVLDDARSAVGFDRRDAAVFVDDLQVTLNSLHVGG